MDYEKKYKESVERLRNAFYDNNSRMCEEYRNAVLKIIEPIFPELRESEDERIRKWIKKKLESKYVVDNIVSDVMADKALAWLEKQSKDSPVLSNSSNVGKVEQKQEWSEEDKNAIQVLKDIVKHSNEIDENIYTMPLKEKLYDWLKSIKDRVLPQPKQEWSEEDEYHKRQILRILKDNGCSQTLQEKTEKWIEERLKSLRHQPKEEWSEEEQQTIKDAASFILSCVNIAETKEEEERLEELADKLQDLRPQNRWKPRWIFFKNYVSTTVLLPLLKKELKQ